MFSPTQGRFVTTDPIGFQAGDVNLYRFVENNPLNLTDPSGLAPDPAAGAKGAIDAMVDKLHWPIEKKSKIKDQLRQLIDTTQFDWFRPKGAFGKCHEWVSEYYSKIKDRIPSLGADGIAVAKREWKINVVAGHGAVSISVQDAPGSKPNHSFVFYLDDGWLGGEDHVFLDTEVPQKWTFSANYAWQGGKESLESCGCEPPIGPGARPWKETLPVGPRGARPKWDIYGP